MSRKIVKRMRTRSRRQFAPIVREREENGKLTRPLHVLDHRLSNLFHPAIRVRRQTDIFVKKEIDITESNPAENRSITMHIKLKSAQIADFDDGDCVACGMECWYCGDIIPFDDKTISYHVEKSFHKVSERRFSVKAIY